MCATTAGSKDTTKHSAKTHLPRERARETTTVRAKETQREKVRGKEDRPTAVEVMDTNGQTAKRAKERGSSGVSIPCAACKR